MSHPQIQVVISVDQCVYHIASSVLVRLVMDSFLNSSPMLCVLRVVLIKIGRLPEEVNGSTMYEIKIFMVKVVCV